jgi:P2 family phage contractile tail tube protein
MSTIYNLDSANLFTGDDDPNKSEFLVIETIKWPSLEEATKEVKPGGGAMSIDLGMKSMKQLTLGFKLFGLQPRVMGKFMKADKDHYTIRGNLFDVKAQENLKVVGVVFGRMVKADMGEFKKEDGVSTDYEIKEITKYKLHVDGDEKYYFDFFAGPAGVRVNGNKIFNRAARNLGLV